jgi:hypothetical protein
MHDSALFGASGRVMVITLQHQLEALDVESILLFQTVQMVEGEIWTEWERDMPAVLATRDIPYKGEEPRMVVLHRDRKHVLRYSL